MAMLIDVTVKIDDTRVTDLYTAIIREELTKPRAELELQPELKPEPGPAKGTNRSIFWGEADRPLATYIWQRIQPGPQRVFAVLLSAPGKRFTSEELIAVTNVPGGRAFAAALTWPGKFCQDAGRKKFWEHTNGQYWIEPNVCAIFAEACSVADNR
jgi:hypothetical protein